MHNLMTHIYTRKEVTTTQVEIRCFMASEEKLLLGGVMEKSLGIEIDSELAEKGKSGECSRDRI